MRRSVVNRSRYEWVRTSGEEPVMRNAEEFSGRRRSFRRVLAAHRRRGPGAGRRLGSGRIRYAHGAPTPPAEPFCTVSQRLARHERVAAAGSAGALGHAVTNEQAGPWPAEFPVGGPHSDVWVLVCGGIAAAAAFTAAFVASGGVASHPAVPGTMPAVVSQACPTPVAGPTP
jgi:hypothetical protein